MAQAAVKDDDTKTGGIAADRLRSIERVERLEEKRKALASDIKDVYADANSAGFISLCKNMLCMYKQHLTVSMDVKITSSLRSTYPCAYYLQGSPAGKVARISTEIWS